MSKQRNLRKVTSPKFGEVWVTEITVGGRRVRRYAGRTKDEAQKTLARVRLEGWENVFKPNLSPATKIERRTFGAYARSLLDSAEWRAKRSARRNETSLLALNGTFENVALADLRPSLFRDYTTARRRKVKPATVNRERSLMVTILNSAVADGIIVQNPLAGGVCRPLAENNDRAEALLALGLEREDLRRLIDSAPDARSGAVIEIALLTGMRLSEILSLEWRDIDRDRGAILVPSTRTKTARARVIPLAGRLPLVLAGLVNPTRWVFPNGKIHLRDIRKPFAAAMRKAKIKQGRAEGIVFHDLRHFAAYELVRHANIVAAAKILGHSDVKMTMRYCHATDADMREGIQGVSDWLETRQNRAISTPGAAPAEAQARPS
jgi:integrase